MKFTGEGITDDFSSFSVVDSQGLLRCVNGAELELIPFYRNTGFVSVLSVSAGWPLRTNGRTVVFVKAAVFSVKLHCQSQFFISAIL